MTACKQPEDFTTVTDRKRPPSKRELAPPQEKQIWNAWCVADSNKLHVPACLPTPTPQLDGVIQTSRAVLDYYNRKMTDEPTKPTNISPTVYEDNTRGGMSKERGLLLTLFLVACFIGSLCGCFFGAIFSNPIIFLSGIGSFILDALGVFFVNREYVRAELMWEDTMRDMNALPGGIEAVRTKIRARK